MDFPAVGNSAVGRLVVTIEKPPPTRPMTLDDPELKAFGKRGLLSLPLQQASRFDDFIRQGYQKDYGKDDALTNIWRMKHNRFRLDDPDSLRDFSVHFNPTDSDKAALLEELERGGLGGAVDWTGLASELNTFQTVDRTNLFDSLDFFASRYAAVEDRLKRNYSGEELQTQMERLNGTFEKGMSTLVHGYLQSIHAIGSNKAQSVSDSLYDLFQQKITSFQGVLGDLKDLSGTPDAWLQDHDAYIAAQLRLALQDK